VLSNPELIQQTLKLGNTYYLTGIANGAGRGGKVCVTTNKLELAGNPLDIGKLFSKKGRFAAQGDVPRPKILPPEHIQIGIRQDLLEECDWTLRNHRRQNDALDNPNLRLGIPKIGQDFRCQAGANGLMTDPDLDKTEIGELGGGQQ